MIKGKQPLIFDARGNGDGFVSCTITGGHNSHISDYTAIVLIERVSENDLHRKRTSATDISTRASGDAELHARSASRNFEGGVSTSGR